ncbi:flavodoxin [Lactococcus chungangensis CAU 28 = DSM 22330]|uniref:Flavodoxin n=1 Tax=Pseudolactococcus chungangensis CAU 28 = DSM 22330 TaxID=1122154 RepID=A0A1K2HE64_9LACT|nr:flavodoxin [Lactococcus chungangensis]PCS02731.1 flavodoxin [Lactococcus chungangensis CAU 28 = DSM 22330]SFZ74793.1 flavodoxin, short chain [Lactococcus chungangensis CAU 28 = DSM 22330]
MTVVKIVFSSATGNIEMISEILEEEFVALGADVEVLDADDDVDEDVFEDADICVVATYTDGDGEIPFNLQEFYEELPEIDLSGKVFGVVGSGDSDLYPDAFCQAAIDFETAFAETGATKGADTVKIENAAEDEDIVTLKAFAAALLEG